MGHQAVTSILIRGMHGIGDNIYSRAVLRQYSAYYDQIWLETPWPQIWHDMPQLRLVAPPTNLRTQQKNMAKGHPRYETAPVGVQSLKLWYYSHEIVSGKWDSLPNAMLGNMRCTIPGDYRLPVPSAWQDRASRLIGETDKPVMIYRPLTARSEWRASATRNPEPTAFTEIFKSIRDKFFVISIADVDDKNEWLVSEPIDADLTFHNGQLDVETLAGLFRIADCVYAAPGFALAMAQAVETPGIFVFGGHESSKAYRSSATFAPSLMIDPIAPCDCFNDQHRCDKRIDINPAKVRAAKWTRQLIDSLQPITTAMPSIGNIKMQA